MITPEEYEKKVALINHYLSIRRFEQVKVECYKLLELNPDDEVALYLLAVSLKHLNDFEESEKIFKQLISNGTLTEDCKTKLADTYIDTNKLDQAEETIDEIIENNPNNVDALILCARLADKRKDYIKIDETATRIFELDPNNSEMLQILLFSAYERDNKKEFESIMKKCFNTSNVEVFRLVALGLQALNLNDLKKAKEYFKEVYTLYPDNGILDILEKIDTYNCVEIFIAKIIGKITNSKIITTIAIVIITIVGIIAIKYSRT